LVKRQSAVVIARDSKGGGYKNTGVSFTDITDRKRRPELAGKQKEPKNFLAETGEQRFARSGAGSSI